MRSDIGLTLLGFAVSRICKKQTVEECIMELVIEPLHLQALFRPLSKGNARCMILTPLQAKKQNRGLFQLKFVDGGNEDCVVKCTTKMLLEWGESVVMLDCSEVLQTFVN